MRRARLAVAALGLAAALAGMPTPAGAVLGGAAAPGGQLRGSARVVLPGDVCSGTLIAPRLVLTALHCVQAPQDGVAPAVLGRRARVTIGNPTHGGRVQDRGVVDVAVAPQVTPPPSITGQVDAAILVLDRPSAAPPIPLAAAGEAAAALAPGAPLLLAGFGAVSSAPATDGTLPAGRFLKVAALQGAACPSGAGSASAYAVCATAAPAPALGAPVGNACAGDSGAPVLAPSAALGGVPALVGLLSGGIGGLGCAQDVTDVVVPVGPELTAWIGQVAGTPLPPAARPPRSCSRLRRRLSAARRGVHRARHRSHAQRRRAAGRLRVAAAAVYRHC